MDFLDRDLAFPVEGNNFAIPEYMYRRPQRYIQPARVDELDSWLMKNVSISGREEYLRLREYLVDGMLGER